MNIFSSQRSPEYPDEIDFEYDMDGSSTSTAVSSHIQPEFMEFHKAASTQWYHQFRRSPNYPAVITRKQSFLAAASSFSSESQAFTSNSLTGNDNDNNNSSRHKSRSAWKVPFLTGNELLQRCKDP